MFFMIVGYMEIAALSVQKELVNGLIAGDQTITNMIIQLNPGNINLRKKNNGCIKNHEGRILRIL